MGHRILRAKRKTYQALKLLYMEHVPISISLYVLPNLI